MSDSPSPPPPPDYTGAAQATAAGNLEAARAATKANRIDQYTPYGNQIYTALPDDRWRSDITLAPEAKDTLDSQLALSKGLGNLGSNALDRTADAYSNPMDLSSVQQTQDQAYAGQTARLDPQWAANDEQQAARLSNQGIVQGSEAYNNAMRSYGQTKNDAYGQARLAAINTAPQTYQLANAIRQQPLNELNAIRTGAQIQNPAFQQAGMQQTTAGPDMLGAAGLQNQYNMGLYNSQVGSANSGNQALMQGLGTAATAMMMFSDRRLKSNITRIGTHPLGIGIYAYEIFGAPAVGVMADEVLTVRPAAVMMTASGYMAVDYGQLHR